MSRAVTMLDRVIMPLAGLALCAAAVLPDVIHISSPALRIPQAVLMLCGLGLVVATVGFRRRPMAALMRHLSTVSRGELALAIGTTLGSLIVGDLLLRAILPPTYVPTRYGWQPQPNSVRTHAVLDAPGQPREVHVRYVQNGFKKWGDTKRAAFKLLVIGDSFTELDVVSSGEEWYSRLAEALGHIEWFVFGSAGFGSLQEYMVADDNADIIRPDAVLWQFCSNDYDNNLYDLDLLSYPYNNHAVRPYLEGGRIVYRLPLPFAAVREHSFAGDRLLKLYDRFMYQRATADLARYLERRRTNGNAQVREHLLNQSYAVTQEILSKVARRFAGRPIYLFNACDSLAQPELAICAATGIRCLPGVSESVIGEEARRAVRVPNDGHWNTLGNRVAADTLRRLLADSGIPGTTNH